jgi:hypothetical protein
MCISGIEQISSKAFSHQNSLIRVLFRSIFTFPFVIVVGETPIIFIHTASLAELASVSGISATVAQNIIETRPFSSWSDFERRVNGIGPARRAAIESQMNVVLGENVQRVAVFINLCLLIFFLDQRFTPQ